MAPKTEPRKPPLHFIAIFCAMALGIAAVAYLHAVRQTRSSREAKEQELSTVVSLKVDDVVHWRSEHLERASFILGSPFLAMAQHWLRHPGSEEERAVVQSWTASFKNDNELSAAFLIDADGNTKISAPAGAPQPYAGIEPSRLIELPGPLLTDIYAGSSPDGMFLCLIVPIPGAEGDAAGRAGTLLLQIDPRVYLFPLVRTFPLLSPTAESILLQKQGEVPQYLSGRRHAKAEESSLPAVAGDRIATALGDAGEILEGTDYRNVQVLAVVKPVPGTRWFIVAKVDKREVYTPIHEHGWLMFFVVGGLILLAGTALGSYWNHLSRSFYLALLETEHQKTELALRHEYLTRYANDIFLLANSSGNIVDANERAVSAYGYTREELVRLCLDDLQEEESLPCMNAQLMKVREENGYIYEAINRRKDGTVFPVEVSARYVMLSDGEYYWATVRDVSERKRLEELFRKERDRAQDYLDIAAVTIVAVDSRGIITLVNREGCRITGYEGEELVGRKWAEFCVPGKPLESLEARFQALMAGTIDIAGGCEFAVRNRAGAPRLLAFHCAPLRNADSEITGLLVSGEDVTERRRADRERMVTIELFKIINSAKSTRQLVDGIALSLKDWAGCDAAALRLPCGPSFPHFDADSPPQRLDEERGVPLRTDTIEEPGPNHTGDAFLDAIGSDVLARRFDPDNPLFTRHGSFWTGRASRLPAFPTDGGRSAEHESIAVVPVRSGEQTLGLLLFMRKRPDGFSLEDVLFFERLADGVAVALAKTQVEEEWLQLAAAVEQAAESFLIIDANKNVRYVNPAFERMSGYTRSEVLHRHISLFRSEFQGEAFYESIWRTALGAGVWNGTIILRKKDGSYLETEATISPVLDDRGEMINGIIIKRDLSPMRRLENQLRQSQKMEAIGTLAGGIAHDFNNILASIIGFTELALSDIPEDLEAYITLQQVLESADRAKELVRQILTVSRKSEQECRPVQVGLIVKEALRLLRASLPATIEVRHSISSEAAMGTTLADPTQIHQILMNLCTNAAHAMRKGGILRVALAEVSIEDSFADSLLPLAPGPFLRLSVSDTGHGIDEEVKPRIFEPYFTTKGQGEGTGLGLSVVYGIVKAINGGVSFESEPDKGTTFHVYFPRLESPGERDIETSTPVPAGKGRILFLDDEPAIVLVGRRLLERLGFTVVAVTSSREGLALFQSDPDIFDLVITDYTMPYLTGIGLADEIIRIRPDIPIILCTGFIESIDEESLEEHGIRELLTKPINLHTLATTIQKVLSDRRG